MSLNNIPGSFGENRNREPEQHNNPASDRRIRQRNPIHFNFDFRSISPERWVDIVCITLIAIFLIVVICIWPSFSAALFEHLLFPIIYVGSRIVAAVAFIGVSIGLLCARFSRRRRYWW